MSDTFVGRVCKRENINLLCWSNLALLGAERPNNVWFWETRSTASFSLKPFRSTRSDAELVCCVGNKWQAEENHSTTAGKLVF